MPISTISSKRKVSLLLLSFSFLLVFSSFASAGIPERCPPRYTSFNPEQKEYSRGERVQLELSGLAEDEYIIEKIEIQKPGTAREIVYSQSLNHRVSPEEREWRWSWDQKGDDGEQVGLGRYYALVKVECCGTYRTDFVVSPPVRTKCCTTRFARLETVCGQCRYEVGEKVQIEFSDCMDCGLTFNRLYIKRDIPCCGEEIVVDRKFRDGFQPGRSWFWDWDQKDDQGRSVGPGRYTVVIETDCCATLRTSFIIYERRDCCRRRCCSGAFFPLLFRGSCSRCSPCNFCN